MRVYTARVSSTGTTAIIVSHGSLALCMPHEVHHGVAAATLARRAEVLDAAFAARAERFVRGRPNVPTLPKQVWINKPPAQEIALDSAAQ